MPPNISAITKVPTLFGPYGKAEHSNRQHVNPASVFLVLHGASLVSMSGIDLETGETPGKALSMSE
jgi:hypothetical protein